VFIALMSSGKREARDVQALVDASRTGSIRRVFTLTEGVFPYPLDDLWAMRTHAMVAMVEMHVVAHLKDVLVWPHDDVSHYAADDLPYVQEMVRLRGVYAPGRVHTVSSGKSGKIVLQANQITLLPCPAPKWHDFRMVYDMASHTDQLGMKGIAEACYLEAVAAKPAEAAAIYNSLALLYSDAERHGDAIAAYNASVQLEENVALCVALAVVSLANCNILRMYVNMGVQLQRAGRSLEAVDAYVKSIAIKPYVEAWHNLAGVYVDLNRFDDAIVAFKKAIEMRPQFAVSYLGLGRCYHRLRRHDDAERALKKGIEIDPSSSGAYLDLGQLYNTPNPNI
jgi:tetratricopeptide (TPR) repeat protein